MQTEQITYAQLDLLLDKIGYRQETSPPDARVFAYPEYDALSVLPCADASELARPHHLITLRKVAAERGIVDDKTFEKLLTEVRYESTESLAKAL